MRHLEEFLDDALVFLQAFLPVQLDAINTEKADDIVLELPKAYYFGGPDTLSVSEYPSIEVAAPDITLQNPSLGQLHWDSRPRVMIRVFLQDPNVGHFTRLMYRYGRAVSETMAQPSAFGGSESVESFSAHYALNPETNERAQFTGGVLLIFNLDSTAARP